MGKIIDGIFRFDDPPWIDIKFPFFGRNLDSSSGRIDYDFAELGVNFADNARYLDAEAIGIICQLNHDWYFESDLHPHVHWIQNQNAVPNILMAHRVYENGASPPSWTLSKADTCEFTYTSGSILQICEFPTITMSGIDTVSAFVDVKIFRDTVNDSGIFSGVDAYTGNWLAKEFDFHVQVDSAGSDTEYVKS